jgi:arabinofuranosyltransferase
LSAADPEAVPERGVEDARHALACGDLARLLDAVSEPLTPDRILANLRSSWTFHTLRVPQDPTEARREFCTPAEDSE